MAEPKPPKPQTPKPANTRALWIMLAGVSALMGLSAVGVTMMGRPPGATAATAIGGPFRLHTGGGKVVTEADLRGAPFLVFFGYTHCPDVCPLTLAKMAQVLKQLGPDARIKALFVTVDPDRDTPDQMADYAGSFDPRIIGLSGDRAEVNAMLAAYRVYARKVPTAAGDYTMDHSAVTYLMDRDGKFLRSVNLDRPPEDAARDLQAAL
ncbi:protein SCO1/2 [Rhodoblastus acidophilus]|uniref:Protein SCO1/2 n=1 Tax=Rhodoblastus acidophilus TaxID=1074 RepID=A0A212R3M2_RHOAC|nr:SCO family protein [Rhodoblastus acidophilus]PPQ40239.1 SCO family protein [Rhodoblastus acidophilus]RAI18149.1 SCO family protein [Rhodoblastus acidophilus]SNB66613.1 protein SCO1/2 [Rhodoblastus acidophilus]